MGKDKEVQTEEKVPAKWGKGWGKDLCNFAAENTAEKVAQLAMADVHVNLMSALSIAEEELNYAAATCLKRAIKVADCEKYMPIETKEVKSKNAVKIKVTVKSRVDDYRSFVLGAMNKMGMEVSADSSKGIYVYAFEKKTADAIMDRASELVDVTLELVK